MVTKSNKTCSECKKPVRKFRAYKNQMLCYQCYVKKINKMPRVNSELSLEKALNKTYQINGYLYGNGTIRGHKSFPSILIGHKVKLVLVK